MPTWMKWLEVQLIHSITTENIRKFQDIFAMRGLPQKIVADNGSAFTSANFKTFMDKNGI